MDRWDFLLWSVAVVGCVLVLVRLMLRRRDQLYEEVQKQLASRRKQKEKSPIPPANSS